MAGEIDFSKLGSASVADLDLAATDRLKDAEALFAAHRHASAISMGLYALEIRLKERICRRLDIDRLPAAFQVHGLRGLLVLAGLSKPLNDPANSHVLANWNEIELWSKLLTDLRYRPESDPRWSRSVAEEFLKHLRDPHHGVLTWLSTRP